uniref:Transposase MuDR plant domain-containing protein n=1 Tax=Tanacetum cinerariifolium TaxID=118510 RepID=A0A699HNU0_TANCI|nr:hypothetical protein [Tanacetum cinerariifolium]
MVLVLEGSQEFLVKSFRILIDNTILSKAKVPRWLRVVPIKVNVHVWRVCLDKLPARANLSLKGMDIPSIACPLYSKPEIAYKCLYGLTSLLSDSKPMPYGSLTPVSLRVSADVNEATLRWCIGEEPVTEYRDYDYVSMEREKNRVCLWSFTTELRSLGFKDCDVNGVYYKEPLKRLTDGMKLINDQASLYDMFSCASRTGVVELYVEHSEEWLRTNNKLVDYDYTTGMSFDQSTGSRQNADDNEESEQDETTSSEEEDHEEDFEAELDTVVETLSPNQDTEVTDGINAVREHYKALNQNKLIPAANILEKELHHGNEENDNSKGSEENYLENSDVESLDDEILEDGTTQMRRTPVRFPRYNENCRTISFFIGQSFNDHTKFKRVVLKYAVQEKREYELGKNARQRVRVKCIDEHCKWLVYAADEKHDGKKYFLVKTLNNTHTCSKVFTISHIKAPWIAEQWETMIYAHPDIKPTYIQDTIKAQLELEVTRSQCKRAKAIVIKRLEKDVLHEYKKLNDYARALVDTNPRSSVDIEVEQIGQGVPPFFKRMYVCLAAVRDGFLSGCRKYLGLDGCFLKGVVKGIVKRSCNNDSKAEHRLCARHIYTNGIPIFVVNNSKWPSIPLLNVQMRHNFREDLREYIMERRIKRLSFAQRWRLICGPNIRDVVNENCSAGCKWKIKWNGDDSFQVYIGKTQHCVHLGDRTCTCGAWELSGRVSSSVGHDFKTCPVDDGGKYQPKKSKTKKPTTKSATKNMPSLVLNP